MSIKQVTTFVSNIERIACHSMEIIQDKSNLLAQVKEVEIFQDIPSEELQWMIDRCEYRYYTKGEFIFEKGENVEYMVLTLEGEWIFKLERDGAMREFAQFSKGNITGMLPYSRLKKTTGYGQVIEDCKLLALHKQHFPELGIVSQSIMQTLVQVMTTRVREFEQYNTQQEKLVALGKLSAGLAHELNNPASAMIRSADELRKNLHQSPERFKGITKTKMNDEQIEKIAQIVFSKIDSAYVCKLSMIEKQDLEDDFVDWLEDHGVEDGEDIAVTFIESGFELDEMDQIEDIMQGNGLGNLLWWMETTFSNERLIKEIQESAEKISKLVQAVKGYSHMDRGQDREYVDIHDGIRSTLIMLKHKLKDKRIQVLEDFDESLPKVNIFVGQMNQVWTNLIDNAIDAMETGGQLTINTYRRRADIIINIKDNGSGIPEDIQNQIFEPFFTTKPMGQGTGMGLDIVHKIIRLHKGEIDLVSQPGETTFSICLPIDKG